MSATKVKRQPKAQQHFELSDPCLPIAGTPPPRPCPFCGYTECSIVIGRGEDGMPHAHVQCDHCLAETGGAYSTQEQPRDSYEVVLEAARIWNQRKGGAS